MGSCNPSGVDSADNDCRKYRGDTILWGLKPSVIMNFLGNFVPIVCIVSIRI
jgi:hypothetical protein